MKFVTITSHSDFAWKHSRTWHEERYVQALKRALEIMNAHPDYIFQLETKLQQLDPFLKWADKHDPLLIDELKDRLNEGRLEVMCGLSNPRISEVYPETIIRNMVLGREYFEHLAPGYTQKVYNAVDLMPGCSQMPQICNLAGYSYYMFTRAQGRQVAFMWVGLDGSAIISSRNGYDIGHDKAGITPACEHLYRPPVERLTIGADDAIPDEKIAEEAHTWDPQEKRISTVKAYFDAVHEYKDKLNTAGPVLDSLSAFCIAGLQGVHNLYYRNNMIEDQLLRCESLELISSDISAGYKGDTIKELWYDLLENTGHALCHVLAEDFKERSEFITRTWQRAREYTRALLDSVVENIKCSSDQGRPVVVANRLGWTRSEVVILDTDGGVYRITDRDGACVESECNDKNTIRFIASDVPACGYKTYYLDPCDAVQPTEQESDILSYIENEFYRIDADEDGSLLIYDKKEERYLGDGAKGGIGSVVFRPASPPECGWIMNGPLGSAQTCKWDSGSIRFYNGVITRRLKMHGTINKTEICRTVWLYKGSRRIDIGITIDSRDKKDGVFRFVMPLDIEGELTAGIPFGAEIRKDYETELFREEFFVKGYKNGYYASRWTDYSSQEYGYTFMCPHGAFSGYELDPETRIFEFTLLRTRSTDSTAGGTGTDHMYGLGCHTFTCAVVPHTGSWKQAHTYRDALEFHNPLMAHLSLKDREQNAVLPQERSYISVSPENVILSCARMINEGEREIRIYETTGNTAAAVIELADIPAKAKIVNFLGDSLEDAGHLTITGKKICIPVGAWKIVTLRITY